MSSNCHRYAYRQFLGAIWPFWGALALISAPAALILPANDAAAQSAGYYAARQSYPASSRRAPRASSSGGGLFGGLFGGGGSSRRSRSGGAPYWVNGGYGANSSQAAEYGGYRTLCVRSCDGYYWPVSYATSRAGFARDARTCASSCAVPAKLFIQHSKNADVQYMVDLQGRPYSGLENAFRYRKEYVKQCRCKPDPWSEAAKQDYARREAEAGDPGLAKLAAQEQTQTLAAASALTHPPAQRPQFSNRRRTKKARWRAGAEKANFSGQWRAGSW